MKTYYIFILLCISVLIGCNTSDDLSPPIDDGKNIDADYIIVMENGGMLNTQFFNANSDAISLSDKETSLNSKVEPQLHYTDGLMFLQYHQGGDCDGLITKHDFNSETTTEIAVFEDLETCELTATALAQTDQAIYISYTLTSTNPDTYGLRVIDMTSEERAFVDISLNQKPIDFAIANNRLFILTIDEQVTDENGLSVIDIATNSLVHEKDLGYDARRIITNVQGNIIIGYDELHGNLNSETFAITYTQYEEETAPKFAYSNSRNFSDAGVLFYPSDPGSSSMYPLVASSYDFENNLVVLYTYDALLSEEKRNFEYKIKTTSAVNYDSKNNIVLVGYEKISGAMQGGLLRIKLNSSNEVTAIDNIDVEGIPFEILVN